jgi:phosphate transport system substrate-binding protein
MRYPSTLLIGSLLCSLALPGFGGEPDVRPASRNGATTLVVAAPETMTYLLSFWLVEFKHSNPTIGVRVDLSDTGSVADALLDGRADIGAMTRPFSDDEIQSLRARFGHAPVPLRVALDAVGVYVNKDNPVRGLTIAQVDAIFSTTRRCGHPNNIFWWDQVGLDGEWALKQIELYGRDAASGARAEFNKRALCGGSYKATLEMAKTKADLWRLIATNRAAIAYSGVDPRATTVRVLPIARAPGEHYVSPDADAVRDGRYPLARTLYLYVRPSSQRAAIEMQFLRLALSPRGQELANMNGFVSLPSDTIGQELAKLN